jgi:hypothetical protein
MGLGRVSFCAAAAGAAILLSTLVEVGSARANLVANPNFDLSPLGVDWTFTPAPSGSDFFYGAGPTFGAFSPPNSANFGAVGAFDDEISQVLATTPGASYTISFELAHDSTNAENDFSVTFGGTTVFSIVNTAEFGYTLETVTGVATSSSTTLAFFGREVPAWYDLDNVSVVPTPEPPTWSMMLVGFAGLGFAGYRRRMR